jgi:hypothetical protein
MYSSIWRTDVICPLSRHYLESQTWLPRPSQLEISASILPSFEVDDISTATLMFRAGYLTIDAAENISGTYNYFRLRHPKHEVHRSLNGALLRAWTSSPETVAKHRKSLWRLLP